MRQALAGCALLIFSGTPAACTCSSSADSPKPEPTATAFAAITDARSACEHRAAWPHRVHAKCTQCQSLAKAPRCGCPRDEAEYAALCLKQRRAKLDAKEICDPVWECTYKCKKTDCDCIAGCYEGQDRCGKLALALDTCLIEVCDKHCRPK